MPIAPGTTLGSYEILASIGAGGMGEVYRARDTKLGREVAIKVLPRGFAGDTDRLARFEREARLLASLNHPNIATLHGLEQSGDTHFLVMELVTGETLRERISRSAIPVKEALPLFQQMAEALEAAHEKGIIHRDLKPANIKITEEGKLKVLDFGLAKAFGDDAPPADLSQSPTITREGTETGVILGTAAYMSPEQARGKTLDKRTDIWSFGCVLFESLTGDAPFLGETVTDTMVRILEKEPDWEALPEDTPPFIRLLLHRCLQKNSRERLHDIADARIEIRDASSDLLRAVATGELAAASRSPAVWTQALPWGLTGLLVVAIMTIVNFWSPWRTSLSEQTPIRFVTKLPPGQTILNVEHHGSNVVLSPDGSRLVYVATENYTTKLYHRSMDSFEAEPIRGTEGARAPFFSPDGSRVGFYADGEVKTVSIRGGALSIIPVSTAITQAGVERAFKGGTWGRDDTILLSHGAIGLERVHAAGGITEPLPIGVDNLSYLFPQLLPGGREFLFTIWNGPKDTHIAVYDMTTGEIRNVLESGTHARYVPTGHLVYAWGGELLAVPFDLETLEVMALPVRVLDNVLMEEFRGAAHFSVSDNGTLVYVPGGLVRDARTLVWVDRTGKAEPLPFPPSEQVVRVSPDGKRVLVNRPGIKGGGLDLWVYDLERSMERRLTGDEGVEWWAAWTPDSQRVVYNSGRGKSLNLYWKPVDGSGPEEILVEGEYWLQPYSWSGKLFAFQESDPSTGFNIWVLSEETDRKPNLFLQTNYDETHPSLSPNGRWLAYASNESGRWEIYVRPYPGPGAVIQISTDSGWEPLWSPDGREIHYRSQTGDQVMVVSFDSENPSPHVGQPRLLFEGSYEAGCQYGREYDLAPDGERFLMIQENEPPPPPTQYNIVLNWFEELKRLVPTEGN